jgi:uridine phosphorylase
MSSSVITYFFEKYQGCTSVGNHLSNIFKRSICALTIFTITNSFAETQCIGDPLDTNFPKDAEGRVYHLGLKKGEIANNILLVGDPDRAKLIVTMLDDPKNAFSYASNRGFTTYTGTKKGKPVTIMAIGMGLPMMDFAVREIRAITDGALSIIRLGSCGTPHDNIAIGTLVVAEESYCITTNYEGYHQKTGSESVFDYFNLTMPIKPEASLHQALVKALENQSNGSFPIVEAVDATADSFYSSQGRIDRKFDDRNQSLIDSIMALHPSTGSLQMETYHLFHLAKLNEFAKVDGPIRVAACAIVLAQRKADAFLSNELKHELEMKAGNACLEALVD